MVIFESFLLFDPKRAISDNFSAIFVISAHEPLRINPATGVDGSLYLRKSKPLQFLNCNDLATKGIYYPEYEGGVTYTFPTTEYGIVCIENTDNSDMCTGDSGGPLIFNRKLYGLNSYFWGSCGQFPSVSTSVAHYYDWIVANSDYRPDQGNIWDDAVTVAWPTTEDLVGTTEEVTTVRLIF